MPSSVSSATEIMQKHWWSSEGFFNSTSQHRTVDPPMCSHLSPSSFLKETIYYPLRVPPSLSLFPQKHTWASPLGQKHSMAALPLLSAAPPPAAGLTTGQPCIHCAAGPQKEVPRQCHGLMLRDSSLLFKWQRCNDSRRQPYRRQDPPDYFVSDIKRSGYTQWKDQGQERRALRQLHWHHYKKGEERSAIPFKGQKYLC